MNPVAVAIIGTTTWGSTLGIKLAKTETRVKLWARTVKEAEELNRLRSNPFPPYLSITSSISEALEEVGMVILAVPAQTMRGNVKAIKDKVKESMLILSAAKGLEVETGKRMSQVIADEIPANLQSNICVLSGPNLAGEIAQDLPAATVVAAKRREVAERAKQTLNCLHLQIELSDDVIGVELGGALKNVIAIGAGMLEGLGYGDNAKAAFIVKGLQEMVALGMAMGAKPQTFLGLAGLGDLIVTCFSPLSRNHRVGVELGRGHSLSEITSSLRGIAEGITTTVAAKGLALRMGVEMPVTEQIYRVLTEGLNPRQAMAQIMP